jgi:hypothetical protein
VTAFWHTLEVSLGLRACFVVIITWAVAVKPAGLKAEKAYCLRGFAAESAASASEYVTPGQERADQTRLKRERPQSSLWEL